MTVSALTSYSVFVRIDTTILTMSMIAGVYLSLHREWNPDVGRASHLNCAQNGSPNSRG
jgi:hypothetical protein